jgi:hypothetical protein
MLGDVYERPERDSPMVRLSELRLLLKDAGIPDGRDVADGARLFDHWDAATERRSTMMGVERALERDEAMVAMLEPRLEALQPSAPQVWLETFTPVARSWVAARRHMVAAFCEDPGYYCDTIVYAAPKAERYPSPPVMYALSGAGIPVELFQATGLESAGFAVLKPLRRSRRTRRRRGFWRSLLGTRKM